MASRFSSTPNSEEYSETLLENQMLGNRGMSVGGRGNGFTETSLTSKIKPQKSGSRTTSFWRTAWLAGRSRRRLPFGGGTCAQVLAWLAAWLCWSRGWLL